MPDNAEHDWRYYNHMPMLTSQWGDQGPQMGGMQDVDLRMFQHETADPFDSYGRDSGPLISPGIGYSGDGQWHSDVDMGTPSATGFPLEVSEGYHAAAASDSVHLQPPRRDEHGMAGTSRPGSAQAGVSPRDAQDYDSQTTSADQRPPLGRRVTAPEPRNRRSTTSNLEPPTLKRGGTSEDGDDDFIPCDDAKNRGRKRQRIPHTAVERRYRENLNAHLDKLRQTVPALAARGMKGVEAMHEGAKPSKCEILNGAIEHIGLLDKENVALKGEVTMLRSRLEELEKWYGSNPRGSAFGA
ncbi:hypothetical protein LTR36_000154 [Oleoguttula mirabilis]|uniref:BHLH domain-containing protein n=1 Tax=Oleoguttula mirabilis TaxID=1507867 RepID=A0AAV9JYX9_9PEZI|nr:hypothetical protein LTR36_000154 [Oleoguttula mirabilis]